MLWLEDKSNVLEFGCAPLPEMFRAIEDHGLKKTYNAIEN